MSTLMRARAALVFTALLSMICAGPAALAAPMHGVAQQAVGIVALRHATEGVQTRIILEGTAEYITDPSHPLAAPSAAASRAKYPQYYSGSASPFRPFWTLRLTTAFAWTLEGFPRGATRWRF